MELILISHGSALELEREVVVADPANPFATSCCFPAAGLSRADGCLD